MSEFLHGRPPFPDTAAERREETIHKISEAAYRPIRFLPRAWLHGEGERDFRALSAALREELRLAMSDEVMAPRTRLVERAEAVRDQYLRGVSVDPVWEGRASMARFEIERASSVVPPDSGFEKAALEYYLKNFPLLLLRVGVIQTLIDEGELALASSRLEEAREQFLAYRKLLQAEPGQGTTHAIYKKLFINYPTLPPPLGLVVEQGIQAATKKLLEAISSLQGRVFTKSSVESSPDKVTIDPAFRALGARAFEAVMSSSASLVEGRFRPELAELYAKQARGFVQEIGLAQALRERGQLFLASRSLNVAQEGMEAIQDALKDDSGPDGPTYAAMHNALFLSPWSGGPSLGTVIQERLREGRSALNEAIFDLETRARAQRAE